MYVSGKPNNATFWRALLPDSFGAEEAIAELDYYSYGPLYGDQIDDRIEDVVRHTLEHLRANHENFHIDVQWPDNKAPRDMFMAAAMLTWYYRDLDKLEPTQAFFGRLNRDGTWATVGNALAAAQHASEAGAEEFYCSYEDAQTASLTEGLTVIPCKAFNDLAVGLHHHRTRHHVEPPDLDTTSQGMPLSAVVGQDHAKRAVEIAVAGGHNMMMTGPPGVGKSLIAECTQSLLPPMSQDEVCEITSIHQAAGLTDGVVTTRPFREVDRSANKTSLIGGGSSQPVPGECNLAHRGILHIDEFLRLGPATLSSLLTVLQEGRTVINRTNWTQRWPAEFQLVASANPCQCGYYGYEDLHECACTPARLRRYREKLSGPMVQRIPIHCRMDATDVSGIVERLHIAADDGDNERQTIQEARNRQAHRYENTERNTNDDLDADDMTVVMLTDEASSLLEKVADERHWAARSIHAAAKIGRTISDLRGSAELDEEAIAEAIEFVDFEGGNDDE